MVNAIRRFALMLVPALFGASALFAQEAEKVKARYETWWLPDQSSTVAAPIDDLFYLILWITSVVFALVFGAQAWFMFRYRYRADRKAIYSHGNNKLEIVWTVIPALILVFLGLISQKVWSDMKIDAPTGDTTLIVDVRPRQFQWDIRYSGADKKFNTPDDITTINQLHVPVNKAVLLNMEAQDVIHSFFVPEFRMKQDAVPGMVTRYWFTAIDTGGYEIACAELCGLGHYRMRGFVTVHTQENFDKWYQGEMDKKKAAATPPPSTAADSAAPPPAIADSAAAAAAAAAAGSTTPAPDTVKASTDTAAN
ncbi:MAG: cytochrome c oxidase subunit II [bacterium]|nr:cytochrome c oxidase subunit II [Candidatus Kapabacteria bacterium]